MSRFVDPTRPVAARSDDGELVDLDRAGPGSTLVAASTPEGREVLRHSGAHVVAKAISRLWPGTHLAVGPATEEGFFYDVELPGGRSLDDDDLAAIAAEVERIVAADEPFERIELELDEARRQLADQPFKLEILDRIASGEAETDAASGSTVSVYRTGADFIDLCRGPHVPSTGHLSALRLLRVSGAYWRGDEHGPRLQRVAGTAFESPEALEAWLTQIAEAERRDHRRLGHEQRLFFFPREIGGGLPVFEPDGAWVRYRLEEFSRRIHFAAGYVPVWTPHVTRGALFELSGHLGWYRESMYPAMELDDEEYFLKPMSCPMHILAYRQHPRSYRELPLRLFELATVYRYERSGTLHGLARVRSLTQDDAHIFCRGDQLADELTGVLDLAMRLLGAFGLNDFEAELSTRPAKSVGSDEDWEFATSAARSALERSGLTYRVAEGEGAFYAPKIDIHLRDAIGRRWQLSTVQVDLQLPQRFDLGYQGADNRMERPFMVHRALFGSVERFLAILIEHFDGELPPWLVREPVRILPVAHEAAGWADEVRAALAAAGVGAQVVAADEPLGARVRRARTERVPYIVVVGNDDVAAHSVGLTRPDRSQARGVALETAIDEIARAVAMPEVRP